MRQRLLGIVMLGAAVCLAGCASSAGVPPTSGSSTITVSEGGPADDFKQDGRFVVESATSAFFVIGGSGSCPPRFTGATLVGGTLEIHERPFPRDRVCTMDYRLYKYVLTSATAAFANDLTVKLTVDGTPKQLSVEGRSY
ncbi:MAG TPA: hypothetical protein VFU07_04110 [Candidatus Lumbricidophila sp.]|nr:hypothetical protein [Candidatus Lumbricidophila sp.]